MRPRSVSLVKGLVGSMDAFTVTDLYSGLRAAYLAPDKSDESISMALQMLAGSYAGFCVENNSEMEVVSRREVQGVEY